MVAKPETSIYIQKITILTNKKPTSLQNCFFFFLWDLAPCKVFKVEYVADMVERQKEFKNTFFYG